MQTQQPTNLQLTLEALKVLWEWSRALLVLQSALVAIMPLLLKSRRGAARKWLLAGLCCFAASTLVALNVLGVIPWLVQQLPALTLKSQNIYEFRNYFGVTLSVLTTLQHVTFAVGFLCLVVSAFHVVRDPELPIE